MKRSIKFNIQLGRRKKKEDRRMHKNDMISSNSSMVLWAHMPIRDPVYEWKFLHCDNVVRSSLPSKTFLSFPSALIKLWFKTTFRANKTVLDNPTEIPSPSPSPHQEITTLTQQNIRTAHLPQNCFGQPQSFSTSPSHLIKNSAINSP